MCAVLSANCYIICRCWILKAEFCTSFFPAVALFAERKRDTPKLYPHAHSSLVAFSKMFDSDKDMQDWLLVFSVCLCCFSFFSFRFMHILVRRFTSYLWPDTTTLNAYHLRKTTVSLLYKIGTTYDFEKEACIQPTETECTAISTQNLILSVASWMKASQNNWMQNGKMRKRKTQIHTQNVYNCNLLNGFFFVFFLNIMDKSTFKSVQRTPVQLCDALKKRILIFCACLIAPRTTQMYIRTYIVLHSGY